MSAEIVLGAGLLGSMLATCLGGLLGYRIGRRHALAEWASEVRDRSRPELGLKVLNDLAHWWGGKVLIDEAHVDVLRRRRDFGSEDLTPARPKG